MQWHEIPRGNNVAAVLGTLFEKMLNISLPPPDGEDPETWLADCSISLPDLRDMLWEQAQDFGCSAKDMGLDEIHTKAFSLDG